MAASDCCACGKVAAQLAANDAPPGGDVVMLIWSIGIAVWQLAHLSQYASAWWRRGEWRPSTWLRSCASGKELADTEACIAQRITAKVDANMLGSIGFIGRTLSAGSVIYGLNIVRRTPRIFSFTQVCVSFSFNIIILAIPSLNLSHKFAGRPGLSYSLVMAFLCTLILSCSLVVQNIFLTEGITLIFRVGMAVRYHRTRIVVAWNLIFMFASGHALSHIIEGKFLPFVVSYELWNFSATVALCHFAAADTAAEARRQVEASVLQGESSALWALLDMVCDVVVPLNEDLTILDNASRFGAMVTLEGRSVQGMRLQEFMPEEADREAFERCARGADVGASSGMDFALPQVVHTRLRDSLGNVIRVELFCVRFQTLLRRRFFVGIREFSDCAPDLSVPRVRRPPPEASSPSPASAAGRVEEDSSGSGSLDSAGSHRGRRGFLDRGRIPGDSLEFRPTSETGIELALVRVMQSCSLPWEGVAAPLLAQNSEDMLPGGVVGVSCCPFHLRVVVLQDRLRRLACIDCAPHFAVSFLAQCGQCGFLLRGDGRRVAGGDAQSVLCFACESEVRLPRQPRQLARVSL